jgi:glycosyltransferase involved in cell wall biosynthesis
MRISVVTNAYNQAAYLREALDSVLSQDIPDLEYLVNDPGSTDGTRAILDEYVERYPGRLTCIFDKDDGPADGLNRAFARATGDWFVYLNADDFLLPGAIKRAIAAIRRYPNAASIFADGYLVDAGGKPIRRAISTPFTARGMVYGGVFVLQQSTFYRADAFREIGGFNVENITSWDAEILLDMALKGMELRHVRGYWSAFRLHPESITVSQRHAAASAARHLRYFETVMGRKPNGRADRLRTKVTRLAARLSAPVATAIRLRDAISPPALRP